LKSEAAKGILRISSNYARLGGNLLLSLILVPFLLRWVGNGGLALVTLLGAGSGFAAMFREITDRAVVRELAAAHHSDDPGLFRKVFNSSLVVSAGAASMVLACFMALAVAIYFRFLNIPPGLEGPAYVLVLSQAIVAVYATLASPLFNMQLVTERFLMCNFWVLADRASYLTAALIVRYGMGMTGQGAGASDALIRWSILTSIFQLIAITTPMVILAARDSRLRPSINLISRDAARAVFSTFRWYVGVEIAYNLFDRVGYIFSNVAIGPHGNLVYGLGVQFVNYINQVSNGICIGLDAISARLESKNDRSLPVLVFHSTRLLALATIPVGVVFFVLAPQLIQLWVGKSIASPEVNVPKIVTTIQIMAPTVVIRAIAGGWTAILYGAGHLRRYAPLFLIAGTTNVVLTTLALLVFRNSPELWKQYLIPGINAVTNGCMFLIFLPRIVSRCLDLPVRNLFTPLIRPALATSVCSPVLFLAPWALAHLGLTWNLLTLAGVGVVFGGLYAIAAAVLVLEPAERVRFLWSPLGRLVRQA
jgi:O-antigen/teichoic acid export membrane protein